MSGRLRGALPPLLTAVAFFLVWELACRLLRIPPFILPSPSGALASVGPVLPVVLGHALHTLSSTLIGFALAVVFGVALGALIGASKIAYSALYPLMIGFNSVPKAALVPVLVIWFGIGTVPAILSAFLISFFPIMVNVATGLATVEPEQQDVLRSLGATPAERFFKVSLPRALPYFFASLKVAVTLAFVGSIISEQVASDRGVGSLMISASSQFNVPLVFGALLIVSAMGVLLYAVFALLESRLTGWAYRGTPG
ncbi:ABC transporter permease [Deinococcus petrolearius]|uniref:ABC transporter permease n=1 Tax=Deinococcus petrolearius TaxID=1751295 RepID=A0ABW1DH83_9DEIO